MRFSKEILAVSIVAATALGVGRARDFERFEARAPIPAAVFLPREGKRVACFITMNSTDEKTVFTKHLNPDEWDLVELTAPSPNGTKVDWFADACKRNIQCDIDVFSGHYAGRFFGETGYSLSLDELENHSCAEDCPGVMRRPREVYLFGCNALSTKENDHRRFADGFSTAEGYYRHLVDDEGYYPNIARRVTDDRYSEFGPDNRLQLRRAFREVPYVYGFYSASPLGKFLGPILENYLRKLGNFTAHFDAIAEKGLRASRTPNAPLQAAMAGQSFHQCSGIDPNDPDYSLHVQICALFDAKTPLRDRMLSAELMLNGDRDSVLKLLPSIQNFIRSNLRDIKTTQPAIFARLKENANAKAILLDALTRVSAPITKIEWLRFANLLGWAKREELVNVVYTLVDAAFSGDYFQSDAGDTICSLNVAGVDRLDYSRIVPKVRDFHFSSESGVNAMRCAGFARYPSFRATANAVYKSRSVPSRSDTEFLTSIFRESGPIPSPTAADRELLGKIRELCEKFPLDPANANCGRALSNLGAGDEATAETLASLLKSAGPLLQMTYANVFRTMTVGLDVLENAFVSLYLDSAKPHPFWYGLEYYFTAHPIVGEANQKAMLTYLLNHPDSRRPDEMVYALREMKLPAAELATAYARIHAKPNSLVSPRVLLGFLALANGAGAEPAFFDTLFSDHRGVSVTNDDDLRDLYATLKLPLVRNALKTSAVARDSVCGMLKSVPADLGIDDFGDVIPRPTPLKTCAQVLSE